jgi:hypothetical protein
MPTYNFQENLFALSQEKFDKNSALDEWIEICRERKTNICICGRKLTANSIYMFNICNLKTICVGIGCHRKFEFLNKTKKDMYIDFIKNIIIQGEYENINNLIEYSENIKLQVIKYFENKYKNRDYISITVLEQIKKDILYLINTYNVDYLNDIANEVDKLLEHKLEEEEEKIRRKQEEQEKIRRKKEEQEKIRRKREEQEKKLYDVNCKKCNKYIGKCYFYKTVICEKCKRNLL